MGTPCGHGSVDGKCDTTSTQPGVGVRVFATKEFADCALDVSRRSRQSGKLVQYPISTFVMRYLSTSIDIDLQELNRIAAVSRWPF
jgi:hypothetical protein